MRIAITHGETIESPSLSSAPHALIEEPLVRDSFDDTSISWIVIDHMIARIIWAEVVLHCFVSMIDSNIIVTLVASYLGCLEQ